MRDEGGEIFVVALALRTPAYDPLGRCLPLLLALIVPVCALYFVRMLGMKMKNGPCTNEHE